MRIDIARVLKTLFLLIAILGIGFVIELGRIKVDKDIVFLIKKNTTSRDISRQLAENNIIHDQVIFFVFSKLYSTLNNKPMIAGEYQLRGGMNGSDLMHLFTGGKVIQHSIMIPEGLSVDEVLDKLSKLDNIEHFPDKINLKEGVLMPDTYFYTYGTLDIDIINRMKKQMDDFISVEWPKRDKKIDKFICSPEEALILASIVEKETYIDSEKPIIAGVYINRIKKGMKLQACPTVIYGLGLYNDDEWDGKLLFSHLKKDSEYNTYLKEGLPPTPICNPGRKAILAVLHPNWSDKLFFVSKGSGKHLFAENFNQHKRNIEKLRSGLKIN